MISKVFQIAALTLLLAIGGWAQSQSVQERVRITTGVLQNVQRDYANSQQLYASGQRIGNSVSMQLAQYQMNLAQQFAQMLNQALQNPQMLADDKIWRKYNESAVEYQYRQETMDNRPSAQIQSQLQQYAAQLNWRNNTAEGRAYQAAQAQQLTQAHNQRMANQKAQFDAHQAKMANMQAQYQTYNNNWQAQQAQGDWHQEQRVNAIYDRYPYVNPNNGQGYWVPNDYNNPGVYGPDGTYTPLQPYHNY